MLCGGRGTRLSSVLNGGQKTLVKIEGRTFLEWLVGDLASQGIARFILCAGYRSDDVERFAANATGPEIVVSHEPEPRGTAGAVRYAERLIRSERFLVVNGDSFCDFPRADLLASHRARGGCATIALVAADPAFDGGFVSVDDAERIVSFREKAFHDSHSFVNAGTYVFERSLLELIPAGRKCSLETEIFPSLIGKGIFGFNTASRLYDIGTPERLERFRDHIRQRAEYGMLPKMTQPGAAVPQVFSRILLNVAQAPSPVPRRPALFLDRDGVINVLRPGRYVNSPADFEFIEGSLETIVELSRAGIPIVVISNQAGVGKGMLTVEALEEIMSGLRAAVTKAGGNLLDVLYCPHAPEENCPCRKPQPGLLIEAAARHGIALEESIMVGDSESDLAAARAAGCRALLVLSGHAGLKGTEASAAAAFMADSVFPDLRSAAPWIMGALT